MPAIVYQNPDRTTILLDIPRSIESAQGSSKQLRSSIPVETPFASLEPKGVRRQELLSAIPEEVLEYHKSVELDVHRALSEIRGGFTGLTWLFPRAFDAEVVYACQNGLEEENHGGNENALTPPLLVCAPQSELPGSKALHDSVVCNASSSATDLVIVKDLFCIPSRSSFLLSTIALGTAAFWQARNTILGPPTQRTFDLILLDPPWANRSVRRVKNYLTAEHQVQDPFDQVQEILAGCLANAGIVAIWITNKPAVRSRVLKSFQKLQLHLTEEWIWIKTTIHGEPVTALNGVWRKPYEMLLLFSKSEARPQMVKRRIIAAVPDVHSRKPCIKELIEPFLPPAYTALELFARYLVAGWWSWGDEVLKFQHRSHWTESAY